MPLPLLDTAVKLRLHAAYGPIRTGSSGWRPRRRTRPTHLMGPVAYVNQRIRQAPKKGNCDTGDYSDDSGNVRDASGRGPLGVSGQPAGLAAVGPVPPDRERGWLPHDDSRGAAQCASLIAPYAGCICLATVASARKARGSVDVDTKIRSTDGLAGPQSLLAARRSAGPRNPCPCRSPGSSPRPK